MKNIISKLMYSGKTDGEIIMEVLLTCSIIFGLFVIAVSFNI